MESFCYPLWFSESWIHAVGGCLCKNSKGEEICCCPGEMIIIFSCLQWKGFILTDHNLQKYQDAFASAFGFFLIGFDSISRYSSLIGRYFFAVSDPVLWFFKVSSV